MPSLIDIINALKLLPVKLTAAQWEGMRADIRERAFSWRWWMKLISFRNTGML